MKFSSNKADIKETKIEKLDFRKSEISNYKDISEIKIKLKLRRNKANARERNRMHGLNKALDRLRSTLPVKAVRSGMGIKHKLSKIETLKIACNYIRLLMDILKSDQDMEINNFASALAVGLSHTTANVVITSINQFSRLHYDSKDMEFNPNLTNYEQSSENWSINTSS